MNQTIPILIVDDRPENLLSLEQLLYGQEYELVRALSGNEALRLTLYTDFALVLMDCQMPDMDGFETAELMRRNSKTRHIPIIFVTAGLKDMNFQFKGYDAGAVDYLTKPIEPVFLKSKVRIFADMYCQRRELEHHKQHLEKLVEERTQELNVRNEELQLRNLELKSVEELLRLRIKEFYETNDQLLATEEMLRVQIEEYEAGQKLLDESNRNLKILFDVSPLAIVLSSFPGGVISEINHTFSDDFGYAEKSVIGKTGIEISLWRNNEERERFFSTIQEQGGVEGFAAEIFTAQREVRKVLVYSNLIDYKGEKSMLTVFMDVTEQQLLEERLRQTQKMEVIGQLAGGVAHDFNNMLSAITGYTDLLSSQLVNNPKAMSMLSGISQAAGRSAELTGQLLTFSRKGQKKNEHVSMNVIIGEVISLLERTIDKNISIRTALLAASECVHGDPALLQNALLNLGVNARDAMPDGGIITFSTANVELKHDQCGSGEFETLPGPGIEISVSDTGTGMSKETIKRIFEPFFTTKDLGKGTGLGLAAVYGTISDHHGCIEVDSEIGTGTTFRLYLPLSEGKEADLPIASDKPYRGSGGILLVDDEEIIRVVAQSLLEDLGHTVYVAEDGIRALEVYSRMKDDISLVILDMQMPRMSGKETLLRLTESYPGVRVLISSGFHQEGTTEDLEKMGAVGFLRKPYSMPDLCKGLALALGNA